MAQSTNAQLRVQGERALHAIARRRLYRLWIIDANIPGTTLILGDRDERRVRDYLLQHGIDIDVYRHPSGDKLSCRAIDRIRWAAALCITNRCTEVAAKKRIAFALRGDIKFYKKLNEGG